MNRNTTPTNDPTRIKKTLQDAQTAAFTTQLFYFSMKVLFCYILTRYRNVLSGQYLWIGGYVVLLCVNVYFILTTGRDPGFQPKLAETYHLEQQHTDFITNPTQQQQQPQSTTTTPKSQSQPQPDPQLQDTNCTICNCRKRIRMKHCYRCGRCVRKFDHHCPWIGSCVGEGNHWRFFVMLVLQCLQAVITFFVYRDHTSNTHEGESQGQQFESQHTTNHKTPELQQFYNAQFGVFAIFSVFMFIYIIFVGSLMLFHAYLLLTNTTTTELMSRSKATYLRGIKGNPFTKGPFQNIRLAIMVPVDGQYFVFYIQ